MSVLENRTGFQGELLASQDGHGRFLIVVIIKGTFLLNSQGRLSVAPVQDPINLSDEYRGAQGASSIVRASDLALFKDSTDIALVGSAYSPDGAEVREMVVDLSVGAIRKKLHVFGERVWIRRLGTLSISEPERFSSMPLIYERAFGGRDGGQQEERNPVGVGFWVNKPNPGSTLPNIENPKQLISSWYDRPTPQGFGFIPGDWQPRKSYTGTYDERWKSEQFPLPPLDFDPQFFRSAHPDLRCTPYLRGDENVEVIGVRPDGPLRFSLPCKSIALSIHFRKGRPQRRLSPLDTFTLFSDEGKLHIVWRHLIQCPTKILDVEKVTAFSIQLSTLKRLSHAIG